jgi:hypothetical protein
MAIVLNNVASPNNTSVINANFQKIEDSINDDLLKREIEVGEANEMRTHFDMNFNKIVNVFDGVDPQDVVTKAQLDVVESGQIPGPTGATGATGAAGADGDDGADGTGVVATIVGGTNVTVDATDPVNPIVNVPTIGGQVDSVVAGTNVTVDATDPANPIVSADAVPVIAVDFGAFIQGVPTDSEKLITIVASTAFTLPAGLTGTEAYAEVVSTAPATFTVTKNGGGSLGTIDFGTGTSAATFTFVTPTAFAIGDRLQLVNQGTADATLADISVTIRGDL